MPPTFNLQGHRGACALKPENTLPSFEAALDAGVGSIETDVHLTRDGVAVLCHDALVSDPPCTSIRPKAAAFEEWSTRSASAARLAERVGYPLVSRFTLAELRGFRADRHFDPRRFPDQDAAVTPLAALFAERHDLDPYTIPTLDELLRFTTDYAGELGVEAGKSETQRRRASAVLFDLELKRVPFHPETIGDHFDGVRPSSLEERIVEAVRRAGVVARTTVRSFDHRCVRLLRRMEPGLTGAVLVAETAPVAPGELVERAEAQVYCPRYLFVDATLVRQVHAAGARVLPWTVNQPEHWQRLLDWGVDGITTDLPDRLAAYLRERGIEY